MKNIGEFLKYIRKQRGLTQEQVAERLNIATPVLSKWENNKAVPSLDMLCRLCNVLNISIEECIAVEVCDGERILPPENYDAVKLGVALKDLRIKNGLSQAEVGKKIFVTSQTVSKWEGGGVSSLEILCKLADIFGVTPTQLLNGLESAPIVPDKQVVVKPTEKSKSFTAKIVAIILAVIIFLGAVAGLTVWLVLKNNYNDGATDINQPTPPEEQPKIQLACPIKSYYSKQQGVQDPVMGLWGPVALYFEAVEGEEIYAAADGVIITCDVNVIVIDHGSYTSHYNYTTPKGVAVGSEVKAGQVIAKLDARYLGFSLKINGEAVEPLDYITELPEPVFRPPVHVHEWTSEHNNVRHWQKCECGETVNSEEHTFENNKCSACGYEKPVKPVIPTDIDKTKYCLPVKAEMSRGYDELYDGAVGLERHKGVDFSAIAGDNVYAVADGVITRIITRKNSDYCLIKIDHGNGLISLYMGVNPAENISEGSTVKKGDVIGVVSQDPYPTEDFDGEHLHFVMTLDGVNVNPLDYIPYE